MKSVLYTLITLVGISTIGYAADKSAELKKPAVAAEEQQAASEQPEEAAK